jgi:hypothetical protein
MQAEEVVFVLGRDAKQYGPTDFRTVDDWLADGNITLDSLIWRPGDSQWSSLRTYVEKTVECITATASAPMPFMEQLAVFLKEQGYDIGKPTTDVDTKTMARIGGVVGFAAKHAAQMLTGQRIYGSPRASGERTSKGLVTATISPVLKFSDVCAIRYGLVRAAGAFVAFSGDHISTAELLWRLETCEKVAFGLMRFGVAVNDKKGFFMRPLVVCSSPIAYAQHQRVLPRVGYRPMGNKEGNVLIYPSVIDLSTRRVAFKRRPGMLASLQEVFGERPFDQSDLLRALASRP